MTAPNVRLETEQQFRNWIRHAHGGAQLPYAEGLSELVSRAAIHKLVARGWNTKDGAFCVRLSNHLGEGLPP